MTLKRHPYLWTLAALSMVLVCSAWVRASAPGWYQVPAVAFAALAWAALLFGTKRETGSPGILISLLHDPILYVAVLFHALLIIQWWNSGRPLFFDFQEEAWYFKPPPHPLLPFSFYRGEALEMLAWFFPAFTIVLGIRHGLRSRHAVRQFLSILLISATALGILGIAQFVTRAKGLFWAVPMDNHFFATFVYENNAASFFVLVLALSTGFLVRTLFRIDKGPYRSVRLALYLVAMVLSLICIHLTLSRAGMLLGWAFTAFAAIFCIAHAGRDLSPAQRLETGLAVLAAIVLGYIVVAWCEQERATKMLVTLTKSMAYEKGFFGRIWESLVALRMWKDYPWFGTGGWGFKHLARTYVPAEEWTIFGTGAANVHNDALQFLVEFGLLGFGLLLLTVIILIVPLVRARFWARELAMLSFAGLVLVLAHSVVDPALRCPPVLFLWLAILTGLSCYVTFDRGRVVDNKFADGEE